MLATSALGSSTRVRVICMSYMYDVSMLQGYTAVQPLLRLTYHDYVLRITLLSQ
jgi:hypothetical protein